MGYAATTYGGVTLQILNIGKSRQPSTIKQKIGGILTEVRVPGIIGRDLSLTIQGVITGTSRDADRTALIALDDGLAYPFSDGLDAGSFIIIPDSLKWSDNGTSNPSHYEYNMRLIEWRQ